MIPWNYFSSFHFNVRWPGRGEEQEIYHFQRFQIFPWSQFALLWKLSSLAQSFLVKSWTIHLFFKQFCLTVFVLIWVFSFLSLFWTISLLVTKNLGMNNPFFETLSLFSFFIFVDNNPTYYKKLMLKDKCDLSISKHIRYVTKLWLMHNVHLCQPHIFKYHACWIHPFLTFSLVVLLYYVQISCVWTIY